MKTKSLTGLAKGHGLVRLMTACCLAGTLSAAPAWAGPQQVFGPQATLEARFGSALEVYRMGRYPEAYGLMIKLAGEGHGDAAMMALLMHRHGARLFGSQWDASPEQLQRWRLLATDLVQQPDPLPTK